MNIRPARWLICGFFALTRFALAGDGGDASRDAFVTEVQPVLGQYCVSCHGPKKAKAGINFSDFTNTVSIYHDLKMWEKVVAKVQAGEMPPDGKPQPDAVKRDALIHFIETTLKNLDEGRIPPDPGRVLIHRLSRTEYNCTIRDLLGVDTKPADKFPSDGGGGGGFDNNSATLFIPPILMERYMGAAADAIDAARPDKIFIAEKGLLTSERVAARKIIEHFALRGFRRPPETEEIERLLAVYDRAKEKGKSHEAAVKTALLGILVSPNFLFRIEADRELGGPYQLTDYELASRLSYFLWSSMPDDGLFRLAARNALHEPDILEAEVRRMLRDPKSRTFSDSFASQWLKVRELKTAAQPDPGKFPGFTPAIRDAMYDEVIDFFDSIVRDDKSLMDVLAAKYTFLNADLAKLYGINGVEGEAMRRVTLTNDTRGGILGMGAVLTLTSYPQRTSPVLRGKWVLEQILGTPPPPPPPLITSLPLDDAPVAGLTLRQQLEKHRTKAECAACHERMDPLGFGLENFDPIGQWRTKIGGQPVDSTGQLPGGGKFDGPAQLRNILVDHKDDFIRNVTEKMLAYALGRGLEYYDVPAVRRICRTLAANDYRSTVLVVEIVKSFPFQYRRNDPVQQASN